MSKQTRRIATVLLAGMIIAVAAGYRIINPRTGAVRDNSGLAPLQVPAPLFEAFDQRMKRQRLAAYVGRHPLLVVFFDPQQGLSEPWLGELAQQAETFAARGIRVFLISPATPVMHRQQLAARGSEGFPFPLYSDPDLMIHRNWEALEPETSTPRPSVYVVDRAGRIRWAHLGRESWPTVPELLREFEQVP